MVLDESPRSFAVSRRCRIFVGVKSGVLLLILAAAMSTRGQLSFGESASLLLLFGGLFLWVNLSLNADRVGLSSHSIEVRGLGRCRRVRWDDIEDLDCSPRIISLGVRGRTSRLKFYRAANGFSFEPFEELQERIVELVMPTLAQDWDRIELPVAIEYPGLMRGSIVGYVVRLVAVMFGPVCFAIAFDGFLTEKALFFVLSLALLSPFFVRDWRRAHGTLELTQDGLRQRNGHEVVISWSGVTRIVVWEPPLVGYGWITIEGAARSSPLDQRVARHGRHAFITQRSSAQIRPRL